MAAIIKKEFTDNGETYEVTECTAVAQDIGDTEADRQAALLVEKVVEHGQEKFEWVVFGWNMPDTDDDFADMMEDGNAWDSYEDTLGTVEVEGYGNYEEYRSCWY